MDKLLKYAALTDAEKKAPYAKYYTRPAPVIPAEQAEIIKNGSTMKPEDEVQDGNLSSLLSPDEISKENGYCLLPDGGGYVAVCHDMPEISFDMYCWWNSWRMAEDTTLRYKIWCPGKHFASYYTYVSEDCGCGLEEIYFQYSITDDPAKIGFNREQMDKAGMFMADGGCALSKLKSADDLALPMPGVVIHFIYCHPNQKGIIMRSRFWKGYQIINGHLVCMLSENQRESEESLKGLFEHNCLEMEYLRTLLPDLYAEQN